MPQRNELLKLLQKYEELFDETLAPRKKYPVESKLKEGANQIFSQIYPVPKVHEETFKNRLLV